MKTRVKICGVTTAEDARGIAATGADYLGLVFTDSPRRVDRAAAREIRSAVPDAALVGVFRDEPPDVVEPIAREFGLRAVQVEGWLENGPYDWADVWHVLRGAALPDVGSLPMVPYRTYLLDAFDPGRPGGTGTLADWGWASTAVRDGIRLFVAGGLTTANVATLVRDVRPFGVDASSSLETAPGRKDLAAVRAFLDAVRIADRERPKRS
jgi:phosphoribosylanthranilate isomerase